jgi:hypothetical protein
MIRHAQGLGCALRAAPGAAIPLSVAVVLAAPGPLSMAPSRSSRRHAPAGRHADLAAVPLAMEAWTTQRQRPTAGTALSLSKLEVHSRERMKTRQRISGTASSPTRRPRNHSPLGRSGWHRIAPVSPSQSEASDGVIGTASFWLRLP